jgi:hypothetical protein
MRILFIILALCMAALIMTAGALWWRLRWQLRRSDNALKNALAAIQPGHEPADKT